MVSLRKVLWKSKFCSESGSGSGSWYYFGFQYQTYISYMEDTHQILFGSANFFKSYCVHMKSPRTCVHPDRQTDRQTKIFFGLFCLLRHKSHKPLSKGENFFFPLMRLQSFLFFAYSVCDEKVKIYWIPFVEGCRNKGRKTECLDLITVI